MSNSRSEDRFNSSDNVFAPIPVGQEFARLFGEYLDSSDLSANSRRAVINDLRKFARWFVDANREPLTFARVTSRDAADFRDSLRRDQQQAVSTVNRALVSVRRFCRWLCEQRHLQVNPAKGVKELRKQELAPRASTERKSGDCFEKSNCETMCERMRCSHSSSIPAAESVIWWP